MKRFFTRSAGATAGHEPARRGLRPRTLTMAVVATLAVGGLGAAPLALSQAADGAEDLPPGNFVIKGVEKGVQSIALQVEERETYCIPVTAEIENPVHLDMKEGEHLFAVWHYGTDKCDSEADSYTASEADVKLDGDSIFAFDLAASAYTLPKPQSEPASSPSMSPRS